MDRRRDLEDRHMKMDRLWLVGFALGAATFASVAQADLLPPQIPGTCGPGAREGDPCGVGATWTDPGKPGTCRQLFGPMRCSWAEGGGRYYIADSVCEQVSKQGDPCIVQIELRVEAGVTTHNGTCEPTPDGISCVANDAGSGVATDAAPSEPGDAATSALSDAGPPSDAAIGVRADAPASVPPDAPASVPPDAAASAAPAATSGAPTGPEPESSGCSLGSAGARRTFGPWLLAGCFAALIAFLRRRRR
jgi:hypothetical protein